MPRQKKQLAQNNFLAYITNIRCGNLYWGFKLPTWRLTSNMWRCVQNKLPLSCCPLLLFQSLHHMLGKTIRPLAIQRCRNYDMTFTKNIMFIIQNITIHIPIKTLSKKVYYIIFITCWVRRSDHSRPNGAAITAHLPFPTPSNNHHTPVSVKHPKCIYFYM